MRSKLDGPAMTNSMYFHTQLPQYAILTTQYYAWAY